jgi:hypothetical protein
MRRLLPVVFVLFCASVVSATSPQNDPCNPSIALTMSDPAYKEATKVAETLRSHGISVRCVLSSKEAQMFEGELGAAFFKSDVGDFEALFLPGSKSWDALNVVEQRGTDGFTRYQFSGTPSYSGTWVGKPVYFFKHGNVFFHSLNSQTISRVRGVYEQL